MNKNIVSLLLLLLAYAPLGFLHFRTISTQEQYQYWPFVLAAFGYLLWSRWKTAVEGGAIPRMRLQTTILIIALVALVIAELMFAPWLGMASALLVCAAALMCLPKKVTNLVGIWLLLWLVIPPPFGIDTKLVRILQTLSSQASSAVLDLLGIDHLMLGNTLEVPGKQFFVDEACSGIVSVMSIVAAGAIYVVWANRTALHAIALLILGIGWAVVMNIARIVAIALAYVRFDVDLSEGAPHEILGLVLFSFTFLALASTDQFLLFVLGRIDLKSFEMGERRNLLVGVWNWLAGLGDPLRQDSPAASSAVRADKLSFKPGPAFASAFTLVGLLFGGVLIAGVTRSAETIANARHITEDTLQPTLAGMSRETYTREHREEKIEFGEFSDTYVYSNPNTRSQVSISFDYPFPAEKGWKELSDCYRGVGWQITHREVVASQSSDGRDWNYVHVRFENAAGQKGYLWFGIFDGTGEPVSPPQGRWNHTLWTRGRRMKAYTQSPHLFQTQVWTTSSDELPVGELENLAKVYLETREVLRAAYLGESPERPKPATPE